MATNAQLLEAARAALHGTLERGMASYEYRGRKVESMAPLQLRQAIRELEEDVARENAGGRLPMGTAIPRRRP